MPAPGALKFMKNKEKINHEHKICINIITYFKKNKQIIGINIDYKYSIYNQKYLY